MTIKNDEESPLKLQEETNWYVMRIPYSNELKFKSYLDSFPIESFIPMHYVINIVKGKKKRQLVPVIHNLIFVHTSKTILDEIKNSTSIPVRYYTKSVNGKHQPIIVPDIQMRNFIAVAGTYNDDLKYLSSQDLYLIKGDKVRITEGVFAGVEGAFVKIKGSRARRVIVQIDGITTIATASIHPSIVEKL